MRSLLLLSFFVLACSDASPAANDAGADDVVVDAGPDVFAPADHSPAPTVTNAGGSVLASPKLVIVTFGDDPLAPQIETFAQSIGKSTYWSATTAEYGVGPATYGGAVHVAAPPATTLTTDALEAWIASQLDGTHPEWPAYDASTIYSIVMPKGAGIQVDGAAPCKSSPAYHYEIDSGSKTIVYAAINRCDPLLGLAGIDYLTAGLSHEWVEASTDPLYLTAPAYVQPAAKYNDWYIVTGGELADMCTARTQVYFEPSDLPFTVQRSWSNAAAIAGHDPCVPALGGPYFAAAPVMPGILHGTFEGQGFTSEGAHAAMGASVDVEIDLFSDAPTDAFTLDASAMLGANLDFTWDQPTGQNGDKRTLTITRKADAPGSSGIDFFQIASTLNGKRTLWIGAVGN